MLHFIQILKSANVRVELVDEKLKISFPKGTLDEELKKQIKERKEEIIAFLKEKRTGFSSPISLVEKKESYELSHAQQRLWILNQVANASSAYNINDTYVLRTSVDATALEKAFLSLIHRHESLRTVFREEDGIPRQIILHAEELGFQMEHVDLTSTDNVHTQIKRYEREHQNYLFNLSKGPLLKVVLLRLRQDHSILLFTMHHIISDAWSMRVLVKDALSFYNSHSKGEENSLMPLSIQYKDYASWQNNQLANAEMNVEEKYWLDKLSGELPVIELPADRLRPLERSYKGARLMDRYDSTTGFALNGLAIQHGATLFMTLLSGVKSLLYRYTAQKDLIVGSPIAGRDHSDLDDQIGFYVNTLVLRTCLTEEDSFKDVLIRVKKTTLEAYSHQGYPFDLLVEKLDLPRDVSRNPLFDVMVVLQNETGQERESNSLSEGITHEEGGSSKFDLIFTFVEYVDGAFDVSIEYNTDIYERLRIERMLIHLKNIYKEVIANPDKRINDITIIDSSEHQQLLHFNATRTNYPKEKTIVDVFEEQVLLYADENALVFKNERLSYQTLNSKSNQVGAYLKK